MIESVGRLFPAYRAMGYTGFADANFIAARDGIWFFEKCERFGYDSHPNLFWNLNLSTRGSRQFPEKLWKDLYLWDPVRAGEHIVTAGYDPDGVVQIRVSDMKDWRYEALVVVHELIEMFLTKHRDIAEHDISDFDVKFAGALLATSLERLLSAELGVDWFEYDRDVDASVLRSK